MVTKGERIRDILQDENPDFILYDGMDEALLGIYRDFNANRSVGVYSYISYISILIDRYQMTEEEALEFFDSNVERLYLGKQQPLIRRGPIELQTHGGEIRWRNIFIREIGAEEANKYLAHMNSEGFKSVFNGKDTTGWAGPIDNYQAIDGALACKKGKGGTIYTKEEYGDFVARMEIKIPKGGNNGLAIRYPGKGDTAYVGMCELQVLDNTAPRYAKLKPQQYHGSAYGMVPAHRGYLREPGEWNYQEVTVKGSTIKVELNGVVILNTDLANVTSKGHPGKTRTKGHFGFAGHGAAVQFRNVSIKRLK